MGRDAAGRLRSSRRPHLQARPCSGSSQCIVGQSKGVSHPCGNESTAVKNDCQPPRHPRRILSGLACGKGRLQRKNSLQRSHATPRLNGSGMSALAAPWTAGRVLNPVPIWHLQVRGTPGPPDRLSGASDTTRIERASRGLRCAPDGGAGGSVGCLVARRWSFTGVLS